MYKIVNDAQNSTETKISNSIQINKENEEWKQDVQDPRYVSKIFSVSARANIKNYKINIANENTKYIEGIKVTDVQNIEKNEFEPQEKFKILIPIKNMIEHGTLKLTVESEIQTKPILYGVAPNSSNQDYALTAMTYEDGIGEKSDEYPKNETKIIIIKEDSQTKEKIEDVEFELLDENKNVVYTNLKTNKEGKIEISNLVPGKYYLKETKAKEGYEPYEEFIEMEISLHEQYTVKVNNKKEEKPKIEIEKILKNKEVTTVERLPITGM